MLDWILLGMAYDVVNTRNKEAKKREVQKEKDRLRQRLRMPVTRGHLKSCKCRLCSNRRQSIQDQLNDLNQ